MRTRRQRLEHLLALQQTVTALHEMRHAGHLAAVRAADAEIEAIREVSEQGEFTTLFPDVYQRGMARAIERRDAALRSAEAEATNVSRETLRTSMVEKSAGVARRLDERADAEKDLLERASLTLDKLGD